MAIDKENLEEGFYWVNTGAEEITVAEFEKGVWWFIGAEYSFGMDSIIEIYEKIKSHGNN